MLLTEQAPWVSKNTVGCVLVVEDEAIIQDAIAFLEGVESSDIN